MLDGTQQSALVSKAGWYKSQHWSDMLDGTHSQHWSEMLDATHKSALVFFRFVVIGNGNNDTLEVVSMHYSLPFTISKVI